MIVVTGGAGFIGKNLVKELKRQGAIGVVILDARDDKIGDIHKWLIENAEDIDIVFHMGAITDTQVMDVDIFNNYNVMSSIFIWNVCALYGIPLIYASSAATYGDGKLGFDDKKTIFNLKPLNPYGQSKQYFDEYAVYATKTPPFWVGLKFFNVYGHGEAHKQTMASVVYHFYNQINETGRIKLFKSHRDDVEHGEQKRDFVYVDDIVDVCMYFYKEMPCCGIYNVGTGKARSYNELAKAVFNILGIQEKISYIDTPLKIRANYQYFTEAKIKKLRDVGYDKPFHELEDGISKYINELQNENC